MTELDWVERTETIKPIFMWRRRDGKHYEAEWPIDGDDAAEMRRDEKAVEGVVLGAHPHLGDVMYASGEPPVTVIREDAVTGPWIKLETPST